MKCCRDADGSGFTLSFLVSACSRYPLNGSDVSQEHDYDSGMTTAPVVIIKMMTPVVGHGLIMVAG
ncbi:hypothetical protein HID58_051523 [Brassica napus]|uniref:Uncharacterized protein n=1 Tax=Brassica napus TaxID=3708 RepID=A0ABQ8A994_BRANA|nr:hypothetical protein HID58_051523 [Brassica napus]